MFPHFLIVKPVIFHTNIVFLTQYIQNVTGRKHVNVGFNSLQLQQALFKVEEWRLLGCYTMWLLFLTRATWHNIPEDAILHVHRRENLKSYICLKLLCI
jgi:hypothetical protein